MSEEPYVEETEVEPAPKLDKVDIKFTRTETPERGFYLSMGVEAKQTYLTGFMPDAQVISIIKWMHGVFLAEGAFEDVPEPPKSASMELEAGEGC